MQPYTGAISTQCHAVLFNAATRKILLLQHSPGSVQSSDFAVFYSKKRNPDKPFKTRFVLIIN